MESAAVFRSFHYSAGTLLHMQSGVERPSMISMQSATWLTAGKSPIQGSTHGWELLSSPTKRISPIASCLKTSDTAVLAKTDEVPASKSTTRGATFPTGFEELVVGVCDKTQIAELKMKIGDFELHLKRDIKSAEVPMTIASPTEAPPIPSKPMTDSASAAPPPPPKSSSEKNNPFTNVPVEKSKKLAALEASGATGYVLVACPTVGSFRKGRTLKGKKQPPLCKEGDVIKEGQTICYLDQFGTELPVKSDAAGEVIKILFEDGEAVGYGDPLIAVLPSFHAIK